MTELPPLLSADNTSQWPRSLSALLPANSPHGLVAGCTHVYVDMGTNIGLMLQNLYAPRASANRSHGLIGALYALGANSTSHLLGGGSRDAANRSLALRGAPNRSYVCALAFEPVPANARRVRASVKEAVERQEGAYGEAAAGGRLRFFGAAIGIANGLATFHLDVGAARYNHWGSSLLRWQKEMGNRSSGVEVQVPLVGLDWLLTRHVPPAATVVAKMDIEGAEYEVLPAAYAALCSRVDALYVETHDRFFSSRWRGHRPDMADNGRVARLRVALKRMKSDRNAGRCRTHFHEIGRFER